VWKKICDSSQHITVIFNIQVVCDIVSNIAPSHGKTTPARVTPLPAVTLPGLRPRIVSVQFTDHPVQMTPSLRPRLPSTSRVHVPAATSLTGS